jgi:glycosyltransferase involved in cell wall biosynthesis
MVEDGVNGLVVEPGDEAALADAIARLLEQPDLARAMGAEGKRKLERESTPGRNAEATRRVYERAVHHAEIDASSANSTEGRGTSPSE